MSKGTVIQKEKRGLSSLLPWQWYVAQQI